MAASPSQSNLAPDLQGKVWLWSVQFSDILFSVSIWPWIRWILQGGSDPPIKGIMQILPSRGSDPPIKGIWSSHQGDLIMCCILISSPVLLLLLAKQAVSKDQSHLQVSSHSQDAGSDPGLKLLERWIRSHNFNPYSIQPLDLTSIHLVGSSVNSLCTKQLAASFKIKKIA